MSNPIAGLGMSRRLFLKSAAVVAGAALPLGWQQALAAEGVLKIVHLTLNPDWSPLRGGGSHYNWQSLIWASPMYFDQEGKIQPYLFSAWKPNDDWSVWTFDINPDAVFSDGTPITASHVKGSWELNARPSTRNQRIDLVLGTVAGFGDVHNGTAQELSGVRVVNDKQVEVTLSGSDPIFDQKIANQLAPIVKVEAVVDENGDAKEEWWQPSNGLVVSGPFRPTLIDMTSGRVEYEPNPKFFGPAPALSRIELLPIEDTVVAVAALQKGEFDAHTELRVPNLIEQLGSEFAQGPEIPKGQHFWFSTKTAPTDDPKVREALVLAIDREGLKQVTIGDGPSKKAEQILNAVSGVDPAFEPYPFDPERARKLLAESSYGGPENLPNLMMVGISAPEFEAAAQYIAEQWRQNLGITSVQTKPQIDAYAGPDQANVQIFRDDVGTRVPDAVVYLMASIHSRSSNAQNKMGGYRNEKVDALLEEASGLPASDPRRDELAREAQRIFRDDFQFIPWYHEVVPKNATQRVQNFGRTLDLNLSEPWKATVTN
jgi:peptide/nickel transport system substrate-binding protein